MKPVQVAHLKCEECKSEYAPQAIMKGDDGNWYIVGRCPRCMDMRGADLEALYAELYAASYNDPRGN